MLASSGSATGDATLRHAERRTRHIVAQLHPAAVVAASNRQVIVAVVPAGPIEPRNFALRDGGAPPAPRDGQVLVRTLAVTMGAGQRAGLQGSASYAGAPTADVLMGGIGIGRVEISGDPSYAPGDVVMGGTGWQEYATLPGRSLTRVPADVSPAAALGLWGNNGLAAYFGLLDVGDVRSGETVVVSAAAGSVGHIVGQIAKLKGARVVGIAGSDEKCALLVSELGFDAAVNYKRPTFRDDFKRATPKRIDVYFDNTGGDVLGSALFRMNARGRIVCCGSVSGYDTANPGPGPRGVPGLLVNNEVRMQGFLVFSYASRYADARAEMAAWVRSGRLKHWATEYEGLESAPAAFVNMLNGATRGTTVVNVAT